MHLNYHYANFKNTAVVVSAVENAWSLQPVLKKCFVYFLYAA